MFKMSFKLLALLLLGSTLAAEPVERSPVSLAPSPVRTDEIGVLTYNVQDLPWPIAGDRVDDIEAIGQRLNALDRHTDRPQIVLLQEAFSGKAEKALRAAGYRYFTAGPEADADRPTPTLPLSQGFLGNLGYLSGEKIGAVLSSGLMIASDFPILSVVREPFPADVCAGLDCLANKGMMLVRVAVPGLTTPLEVFTTHLNAADVSRTAPAQHLYAYQKQLDAIDRFLARHATPGAARIMGGDFNVSHSQARLNLLYRHMKHWDVLPVAAMGKDHYVRECSGNKCDTALPFDPNVPLIHTLDWQFTGGRSADAPSPVAKQILFGRDANGQMLSDHIGFAVRYRMVEARDMPARS